MSALTVHGPSPLRGRLRVPGDKSISHRALLLGAIADGTTVITGLSGGEDVRQTRLAIEAMGAVVTDEGDEVCVDGGALHQPTGPIDVGNSGTGIRLLAGLCAGLPWTTVLDGDDSIRTRPMDRVTDPLALMGVSVGGPTEGRFAPLEVHGGGVHGIDYTLPVASGQVKGAVLLAGLAADGPTVVREKDGVVTRAHTEEMLDEFGANVTSVDGVITLQPSRLTGVEVDVPGDPSQAAFWVVAACVVPDSDLTVESVYLGPARNGFLDVLLRMGADLEIDRATGDIRARSSRLRGTDVTPEEIPGLVDEVPALVVAAAVADGATRFLGAGELRVKETDRIATITSELGALGARVEPLADGLVVQGAGTLHAGRAASHGDHRIAMAAAVAGLAADGETTVEDWDVVGTSYPGFAQDLERLTT